MIAKRAPNAKPRQTKQKIVPYPCAGGVVVAADGNVCVVNQNGNSWSLPKGHVEPGESDLVAAQREIAEESGLTDLLFVADLGAYTRTGIGKGGIGENRNKLAHIHFFLFTTTQTKLKPGDPENPDARWVAKTDVADLLTHRKDKQFFRRLLDKKIL